MELLLIPDFKLAHAELDHQIEGLGLYIRKLLNKSLACHCSLLEIAEFGKRGDYSDKVLNLISKIIDDAIKQMTDADVAEYCKKSVRCYNKANIEEYLRIYLDKNRAAISERAGSLWVALAESGQKMSIM